MGETKEVGVRWMSGRSTVSDPAPGAPPPGPAWIQLLRPQGKAWQQRMTFPPLRWTTEGWPITPLGGCRCAAFFL